MSYQTQINKDTFKIILSGEWIGVDVAKIIQEIKLALPSQFQTIEFFNDNISKWDSSLLAVIYAFINTFSDKQIHINSLPKDVQTLLDLAMRDHRKPTNKKQEKQSFLEKKGQFVLNMCGSVNRGLSFICEVLHSFGRFLRGKAIFRRIDFLNILEECAPKAVGIVSLISLMVGLILAFVGAIQLRSFGAEIYISSLVTIGMTRIMGAIMIGIIMAGRTGASYAASIGTMQVNEELDALKTMGIPQIDFLVLPRLNALVISMPFLVILSDFMGMIGGAFVGVFMLGLAPEEYIQFSIDAFNLTNFLVGILHGIVFGFVISICGSYFGVKCGRDSGSVGLATTKAVVYSIVWMIIMTGILTLICEAVGI